MPVQVRREDLFPAQPLHIARIDIRGIGPVPRGHAIGRLDRDILFFAHDLRGHDVLQEPASRHAGSFSLVPLPLAPGQVPVVLFPEPDIVLHTIAGNEHVPLWTLVAIGHVDFLDAVSVDIRRFQGDVAPETDPSQLGVGPLLPGLHPEGKGVGALQVESVPVRPTPRVDVDHAVSRAGIPVRHLPLSIAPGQSRHLERDPLPAAVLPVPHAHVDARAACARQIGHGDARDRDFEPGDLLGPGGAQTGRHQPQAKQRAYVLLVYGRDARDVGILGEFRYALPCSGSRQDFRCPVTIGAFHDACRSI